MPNTIEKIEAKFDRLQKAREIVAHQGVHIVLGMRSHYTVDASDGKNQYMVNAKCTCPDANERADLHDGDCKHKLAVLLWLTCDARTRRGESVPKEW